MKNRIFTLGLLGAMVFTLLSSQSLAQCCVAPANLTVTSIGKAEADLQWQRVKQTACTTPVLYRVQYRVSGTTIWTIVNVRTRKDDQFGDTTLKGLTPATTYQWRVIGICSSTNKTAFVKGPNFTTLAAPAITATSVSSASAQGKLTVTAYPNPVISELKLTGQLKTNDPIDILIVNSTGQTVFHQSYHFNSGDFSTFVDVSKLSAGVYIVVLSNKTEKAVLNILKQ
jgi:hypothetical protein